MRATLHFKQLNSIRFTGSWREIAIRLDEPCGVNATAAGGFYASDWDLLVELGVVVESSDGYDDGDRGDVAGGVMVNATSALVTDFSSTANALIPAENLEESFSSESFKIAMLVLVV